MSGTLKKPILNWFPDICLSLQIRPTLRFKSFQVLQSMLLTVFHQICDSVQPRLLKSSSACTSFQKSLSLSFNNGLAPWKVTFQFCDTLFKAFLKMFSLPCYRFLRSRQQSVHWVKQELLRPAPAQAQNLSYFLR